MSSPSAPKKSKPALQAAGHAGVQQSESGDLFYKPTDIGEIDFYKAVISDHPEFLDIIPTFYGQLTEGDITKEKKEESKESSGDAGENSSKGAPPVPKKKKEHIAVLKSSLYGFDEPCILDIKLGHILWDDKAAQEKRDRLDEVARTTTSGSLDMRLTGMNVFYDDDYTHTDTDESKATKVDGKKGERVVFDKIYGRILTDKNFSEGLVKYFIREPITKDSSAVKKISKVRSEYYSYALEYFVERLKIIHKILRETDFEMRGASLLFVYEGSDDAVKAKLDQLSKLQESEGKEEPAKEEPEDEDDEPLTSQDVQDRLFKLDLIDFAHTKFLPKGSGPDEGVVRGIGILIDIFEKYLEESKNW